MEVKKVLVSAFLLTTCLMSGQAQRRNEIQVPDLDGYTTLKCDFHIHSVFSDGLVWPTVRVDEAYRDGLDAISLTEHIEYRPHKQDVVSDHNRSFDLCREQAEKLGILLIKGSEEIYRINLSEIKEPKRLVITCDYGSNVVLLENGRISIVQADCPDKLCVEQGAITTGGVPIVCLPHKLYINITDDSGETL